MTPSKRIQLNTSIINETELLNLLQSTDKLTLVSLMSKFPIPTAILDRDGRFVAVNQLYSDIYACDALFLQGKLMSSNATDVAVQFRTALNAFDTGAEQFEQEFYFKGRFFYSYLRPLRVEKNSTQLIILSCADVTQLKRRERVLELNNKRLQENLYIDTLTGLKNKLAFKLYLQKKNTQLKQEHHTLSLLKIDLDEFKRYNQTHSYTQGDETIIQVAQLLQNNIDTEEAQIYRFNSSNFIIAIENKSEWSLLTLAERLKALVYQQNIPFAHGLDQRMTACIGLYLAEYYELKNELELLNHLDYALICAKNKGKHQIYFHHSHEST